MRSMRCLKRMMYEINCDRFRSTSNLDLSSVITHVSLSYGAWQINLRKYKYAVVINNPTDACLHACVPFYSEYDHLFQITGASKKRPFKFHCI